MSALASTGTDTDTDETTENQSTVRLRLDLAYDGTHFSGWARQPSVRTVQGCLEEAITTVLRLAEPANLVVAGRTDAGVHARGQVAHVDLPGSAQSPDEAAAHLHYRLRRVLPQDIVISAVTPAMPGFDARFSATWRRYIYRVWDEASHPDPLLRGHIASVRGIIDTDAAQGAGELLIGLRDFAAFCKPREGATTIRALTSVAVERQSEASRPVAFTLVADAFCHSMVRSVVGALVGVATGQRNLAWLESVLTTAHRHNQVFVMPPHGLCLEQVGYPDADHLAIRAQQARAMRSITDAEVNPPPEKST